MRNTNMDMDILKQILSTSGVLVLQITPSHTQMASGGANYDLYHLTIAVQSAKE